MNLSDSRREIVWFTPALSAGSAYPLSSPPPHATLSAGCFPEGRVKYIPLIYGTIRLDCQLIVNSRGGGGSEQYGTGRLKSPGGDR